MRIVIAQELLDSKWPGAHAHPIWKIVKVRAPPVNTRILLGLFETDIIGTDAKSKLSKMRPKQPNDAYTIYIYIHFGEIRVSNRFKQNICKVVVICSNETTWYKIVTVESVSEMKQYKIQVVRNLTETKYYNILPRKIATKTKRNFSLCGMFRRTIWYRPVYCTCARLHKHASSLHSVIN